LSHNIKSGNIHPIIMYLLINLSA